MLWLNIKPGDYVSSDVVLGKNLIISTSWILVCPCRICIEKLFLEANKPNILKFNFCINFKSKKYVYYYF